MRNATVLIVDDETNALEVLSLAFEVAGFSVTSARGGAEALETVGAAPPDAVVTDIHMPRMNGRDFVHELTRRHGGGTPPVVALTADRNMVRRLEGHSDFFAVLIKPVDAGDLIRTVREAIGASSSAGEEVS